MLNSREEVCETRKANYLVSEKLRGFARAFLFVVVVPCVSAAYGAEAVAFNAQEILNGLNNPASPLLAPVASFKALPPIDTTAAKAALETFKALVGTYSAIGAAAPAGSSLRTAYDAANTYITNNTAWLAANIDIQAEGAKLETALTSLKDSLSSTVSSNAVTALTSAQAAAQASIGTIVTKIQEATQKLQAARAVFDQIATSAQAAQIAVPAMPWPTSTTTTPTTQTGANQ